MSKKHRSLRKSPRVGPGAVQTAIGPGSAAGGSAGFSGGRGAPPRDPRVGGHLGELPANAPYQATSIEQPPNTIDSISPLNWFSPFQPVWPFGPPYTNRPREWDYGVGTNLEYYPERFNMYDRLRAMSRSWGVLRAIIETRKDQLLRLPWNFQIRGKPLATSPRLEEIKKFFKRPDRKHTFGAWARMLLEDLFVIDAPTLYVGDRDRAGRPLCVEVFDGARIKVLIDDLGRVPDYPNPAYQQITKGLPMLNMTEKDLIYRPMRPTPELPIYGYSPVEQIYTELTEAIRKTMYQLDFWVEGNLPDMIMSVPKDWTATQIATFQALFDSTLSGNLREKSKVRFVPEGMKPYDVKNSSGEALSSTRDEILIRLACFAFSVSPTPFMSQVNRSTAETAAEEATQEGLLPLMTWFKDDIMDWIVQEEFGYDEIEFTWLPSPEVDLLRRSQISNVYVRGGMMTINEARAQIGLLPVSGGDKILVYTNNGVMTLEDAIKVSHTTATAPAIDPGTTQLTGGAKDNSKQQGTKEDPSVDKLFSDVLQATSQT